jgi:penicillin-binding protein 2
MPACFIALYSLLPLPRKEKDEIVTRLAPILEMSEADIRLALEKSTANPFLPTPIKKHVQRQAQIAILTAPDHFPGISVEQDMRRHYPYGEAFSHALGYTGEIDADDIAKSEDDYYPGEEIGKSGLEQKYDEYLHGVAGKKFSQRNAQGELQASQNEIAAQSGNNVVLSIDAELQKYTYQALNAAMEKHKTRGAAAVFQDPRTGKVLSLVSVPSFNNNLFAQGIGNTDYQQLINNPLKPLFNRVTAGVYPPASTVKPLVAGAAVQEGVIEPETIVYSPNQISLAGTTYADWTYWLGRSGPGNINAVQAIAQSTDTFFYKIGGGFEQQKGMGVEALHKYFIRAGLGGKTGIDLPGEAKGLVPNPAWKAEQFPDEPSWYVGNTFQLSIGQSYLLATPLQVNVMTSAFANNGMLMQPQLVEKISTAQQQIVQEFQPKSLKPEPVLDREGLKVGQQGMRESVSTGIIFPLRQNPFNVAAKTGTAEFGNREVPSQYGTHSWITGYAPFDNPQLSFTILLDSGGSSTNAAEVADDILKWYHQHASSQKQQ